MSVTHLAGHDSRAASRVIKVEALVGSLLGAVITAIIFVLAFQSTELLSLSEFNLDLVLQTTGLCVLSTLGVSLGRRLQLRRGRLPIMPRFTLLPQALWLRIITITAAALLVFALPSCWLVTLIFPAGVSWNTALIVKAVYGAVLGAATGGLAVRAVMGEAERRG
jgi:hypothetical protein